jgi:hypothetical protein
MAKKKMLPLAAERSAGLEARIESYGYRTEKQKMFGHETCFTNGYMFAGPDAAGMFLPGGEEAWRDEPRAQGLAGPFRFLVECPASPGWRSGADQSKKSK